jgi:AAA domain
VEGGEHDVGSVAGLLGETRAGKSAFCKYYASQFPTVISEFGERFPVLYLEASTEMTPSSMAEKLYLLTGARSIPGKMKVPALIANSIQRLVRLGTQLLIIDDAQYLFFDRSREHSKHFFSFVKQLADANSFNILLSGEDRVGSFIGQHNVLSGRGGFPQHAVKPLGDSAGDFEKFKLLLHSVDQRLPFAKVSGLSETAVAQDFYRYSDGMIGRVMNIIRPAAYRALNADSANIMIEHLYEEAAMRPKAGDRHIFFRQGK